MKLEDRVKEVLAKSYEVKCQCSQTRREKSQIRQDFYEQLHEWRIARMKQAILVAEIKKSCLLTDACLSVQGPLDEHCQLRIQ